MHLPMPPKEQGEPTLVIDSIARPAVKARKFGRGKGPEKRTAVSLCTFGFGMGGTYQRSARSWEGHCHSFRRPSSREQSAKTRVRGVGVRREGG